MATSDIIACILTFLVVLVAYFFQRQVPWVMIPPTQPRRDYHHPPSLPRLPQLGIQDESKMSISVPQEGSSRPLLTLPGAIASFFLSWRIRLIHRPAWYTNLAKESYHHNKALLYVVDSNTRLQNVQLPQAEMASYYTAPEDLMADINSIFSEQSLYNGISPIHHEGLPLRHGRRTKQVFDLLRNTLLKEAPTARRIINRAWRKGRRKKRFGEAMIVFMQTLHHGISQARKGSSDLKSLLTECMGKVMSKPTLNTEQGDLQLQVSGLRSSRKVNDESRQHQYWGLLETGLLTGFSYYVHDLDDVPVYDSLLPPGDLLGSVGDHAAGVEAAAHGLDMDHIGTVTFPFFAALIEASKQIDLLQQKRTSKGTAALNFTVNIAAKGSGAFSGGMIGKIIGTIVLPGGGTVVGGAIGAWLGARFGGQMARKWRVKRHENAVNAYNDCEESMEEAMNEATKEYYDEVSAILRNTALDFEQEAENMELQPPTGIEMLAVAKKLEMLLDKDLRTAGQWYTDYVQIARPSAKVKRLAQEVGHYMYVGKQLSERLKACQNATDLAQILVTYRNTPLIGKGSILKQQHTLEEAIQQYNAKITLGMAGWVFAVQGLYGKALEKNGQKIKAPKRRLDQKHATWDAKLEKAAAWVNQMSAQR